MVRFLKKFFSREARLKARWEARFQGIDISKFAVCVECDDPIVPGNFVGECSVCLSTKKKLIHAGFRAIATNQAAFCESAGFGIGYWDGEKIVKRRESAASKAMRTGSPVFEEY